MFHKNQNDYKMGDFSTTVFCLIVVCVFVLCESIPFLTHEHQTAPGTLHNQLHLETRHFHGNKTETTLNMENTILNNYSSKENGFKKRNSTKTNLLNNIELFTKKLFTSLLRSGKTVHHKHAKVPNVIEMKNAHNGPGPGKKTFDKKRQLVLSSDLVTTKSTDIKDTAKTPVGGVISEPSADQNVPEHRKHRQRRSFLHDYGLALAYSNDEGDVIFGAHTAPCAYSERNYCLNGGTCVFVGALGITTCQCKIGYTGLRCQSINQEFLMALLSEEFFR